MSETSGKSDIRRAARARLAEDRAAATLVRGWCAVAGGAVGLGLARWLPLWSALMVLALAGMLSALVFARQLRHARETQ